jgi:hypothetical protein
MAQVEEYLSRNQRALSSISNTTGWGEVRSSCPYRSMLDCPRVRVGAPGLGFAQCTRFIHTRPFCNPVDSQPLLSPRERSGCSSDP